ncbi:MAG: rhomboid family intramembrane serine protease [Thermodesulfobacteriota bacterium]
MVDNTQSPVLESDDDEITLSCSLVLAAMGIEHRIVTLDHTRQIVVDELRRQQALDQLEHYFQENRDWPPRTPVYTEPSPQIFQPPSLLLVGMLALFYSVTGPWNYRSDWFINGAGDGQAILAGGEWYRLVTALTLHADLVHLMGNCLFGGFVLHFLCRLVGNGLGLFGMLFTATVANGINVLAHGHDHRFVGFSTAVFAVIGILSSYNYPLRRHLTGYHLFMPLMAGFAFLAMLGSSGENTDLGAHLFGLLCGLAFGLFLHSRPMQIVRFSFSLQSFLVVLFGLSVFFSWHLAMGPL